MDFASIVSIVAAGIPPAAWHHTHGRPGRLQQPSYSEYPAQRLNCETAMTRDRKSTSQKAIASDGTKGFAGRKMRSDKPNVPVGWMDETEILEAIIDEHEAEAAAAKGKK